MSAPDLISSDTQSAHNPSRITRYNASHVTTHHTSQHITRHNTSHVTRLNYARRMRNAAQSAHWSRAHENLHQPVCTRITHHASHVTRHTSHTSHVMQHLQQQLQRRQRTRRCGRMHRHHLKRKLEPKSSCNIQNMRCSGRGNHLKGTSFDVDLKTKRIRPNVLSNSCAARARTLASDRMMTSTTGALLHTAAACSGCMSCGSVFTSTLLHCSHSCRVTTTLSAYLLLA